MDGMSLCAIRDSGLEVGPFLVSRHSRRSRSLRTSWSTITATWGFMMVHDTRAVIMLQVGQVLQMCWRSARGKVGSSFRIPAACLPYLDRM